jgi:hypothetical protein
MCCVIDNEWSKKCKQREINFYAEHAVKTVKLEEDGIICSYQKPPAGIQETYKIGINKKCVEGIVPHATIGQDAGKCEPLQPNVWNVFTKPLYDITTVPIKGYNKYLTDPEYIKLLLSKVINLMKKWQKVVCVAITESQQEWNYPFTCVENQYTWACNKIDSVMHGLQNFCIMSVSHMNIMSVVELVGGIDDKEQADFAVSLVRCQTIEIAVIRHLNNNDCSVVTIFDNSYAQKVAYGKGSFPNFSDEDTVYTILGTCNN